MSAEVVKLADEVDVVVDLQPGEYTIDDDNVVALAPQVSLMLGENGTWPAGSWNTPRHLPDGGFVVSEALQFQARVRNANGPVFVRKETSDSVNGVLA